jgi:hypothetical protein
MSIPPSKRLASDAQSLCSPFYPIADFDRYQSQAKAHFGLLIALHFIQALVYALHLLTRWSHDYLKNDKSRSLHGANETNNFLSMSPPKIHKKLVTFSVANCIANLLLGLSWLFWLIGKLLTSRAGRVGKKDEADMNDSIRYHSAFFCTFPVGIICFLIALFSFSDRFVSICIHQKSERQFVRLFSRRFLWIPVLLFVGIASSGFVTLSYQLQLGNFQAKCFEDPQFENAVTSVSSGALYSFDFNCSFVAASVSARKACASCAADLCKLQIIGTKAFVAFLFFYLLAAATGLISAFRMWFHATRQLFRFFRSFKQLLVWKMGRRRNEADANKALDLESAASRPFALVWVGLVLMVLSLMQRLAIFLLLVYDIDTDSCSEVQDFACSPCDTKCRSVSEVLSNWILLDPLVLSWSSLSAELLVSAIMGFSHLWLVRKAREGKTARESMESASFSAGHIGSQRFEMTESDSSELQGLDLVLGLVDVHSFACKGSVRRENDDL